jgi:NADH dehydrogenase
MKNVFVLGGSGFVGAHVCEKLVREGWHVTVPSRRRNNARNVMHLPGLTILEVNVHDEAALTAAVAGHDSVVNLVAILHGSPAAFDKVHVVLPQKLARACRASAVKQLVHVSALGADDNRPGIAPSEYLRSKGRGEAVLMHPAEGPNPFAVTVLRPSVIFGAGDKFLNLFAKLQRIFPVMPLAGAGARFQPVWVEDVAGAVVASLKADVPPTVPPQIFELCGPKVYTLKELVQLAARLSDINDGLGRPVLGLPHWMAYMQALAMEWAPGPTLMSRDNLASMQTANVATPGMPGLDELGIALAALEPVARQYLSDGAATHGLLGIRKQVRTD